MSTAGCPLDPVATITTHGVRLRLSASDRELLGAMVARLPQPWKASTAEKISRSYSLFVEWPPRSGQRPRYVLHRDGEQLHSTNDLDEALLLFEAGARFHVAERCSRRTFVHAGAVSWGDRAVVLPAVSGGGKTTLTSALVRAGAAYLSDEYAPLDELGRVHPFPKTLSIVQKLGRPVTQAIEALGGIQETRPLPVSLVVLTAYAGTERRWRPRTLSSGQAVLELLQHTVSTQRWPAQTIRNLERVAATATVLTGKRGDADETAALILKRL
jgi:hypothetical protein